jgi:hypothetical protein
VVVATILLAGSLGTISRTAAADPFRGRRLESIIRHRGDRDPQRHAPAGKVLLFSYIDTAIGSKAGLYDPTTGTTADVSISFNRGLLRRPFAARMARCSQPVAIYLVARSGSA